MGKPRVPTIPKGDVKVIYRKGEIDTKLDDVIRAALQPFGYKMWASGCDRTTGIRDLAFRKGK